MLYIRCENAGKEKEDMSLVEGRLPMCQTQKIKS
jgi:hypothetical protein